MSAPLREQLKNNAATTLNGSINNSVTSITVTDGSVFPSTGNFRLICDDEIMLCTARSSNTLTVVRAQESTSAASHADASAIAHVLTADGLDRWGKDNVPMWGYSSSLALNKLVADNGSTLLTTSDFAWINQGSAAVSDQNGTIVLRMPTASGENVRIQKLTAPSAPYSYIGGFQCVLPCGGSDDFVQAYLGFRESSSSKLYVIALNADGGSGNSRLSTYKFNSPTSFNSAPRTRQHCNILSNTLWFKIEDDNTNLKFYIGDGLEWILIDSAGRAGFMSGGPNEVFWGGNNGNNGDCEALVRLIHWSRNS